MRAYLERFESPSVPRSGENPSGGPPRFSRYSLFVLRRFLLVPAQLLFVLVLLYLTLYEPTNLAHGHDLGPNGFLVGLAQKVVNDFTGTWGPAPILQYPGVPMSRLYLYLLPTSVELALISLGFAAAIAYPVSLLTGWSRRSSSDVVAQFVSLFGTFLPVMVAASVVVTLLFFWFERTFSDLPDAGTIPSLLWFIYLYGHLPPWLIYGSVTRPTGFPLIDGVIQKAWGFEIITLLKTLIQALIIAIVYETIFHRHGRSVVLAASKESHLVGARSRAISERTLLWKHTARRVRPTFLLTFTLTLPAYLGTQFAVEAAFLDRGIGFLTLSSLTDQGGGGLPALQAMMFMLSILILAWLFVVDLVARRMDPRELTSV